MEHNGDEYSTLQTRTRISTWRPFVILKAKAENSCAVLAGFRAMLHLRPVFWTLASQTYSFFSLFFVWGETCRKVKKKRRNPRMPQASVWLCPTGQRLNLKHEQAATCMRSVRETNPAIHEEMRDVLSENVYRIPLNLKNCIFRSSFKKLLPSCCKDQDPIYKAIFETINLSPSKWMWFRPFLLWEDWFQKSKWLPKCSGVKRCFWHMGSSWRTSCPL